MLDLTPLRAEVAGMLAEYTVFPTTSYSPLRDDYIRRVLNGLLSQLILESATLHLQLPEVV